MSWLNEVGDAVQVEVRRSQLVSARLGGPPIEIQRHEMRFSGGRGRKLVTALSIGFKCSRYEAT